MRFMVWESLKWLLFQSHRVLIVDWDVHHGQGIQYIFEEDPRYIFPHRHIILYTFCINVWHLKTISSLSSCVAVCCISQCTDMKMARSGRISRSLTAAQWVQELDRATISTCPGTRYTTLIYAARQCLCHSFQKVNQFTVSCRSPPNRDVENDHLKLNHHLD